ncbi:MAG: GNAT family N-acetyltransferase [Acutalibacteraceae bacterium]|nr:GNAT family N-acetyltransferase [Acutalibacteraceae bacterium]
MSINIIRVKSNDVATLAMVGNEIWHEYYTPLLGVEQVDYMVDKFQSVKGISYQLDNGYEYYFAVDDDKIAGYFGVQPQEESLFLSKLYLKKDFRGKGIASVMLAYIKEIAEKYSKNKITLTVNRYNDNTIAVYKHLGFEIIEEQKADIGNGFYMDDYVMQLQL